MANDDLLENFGFGTPAEKSLRIELDSLRKRLIDPNDRLLDKYEKLGKAKGEIKKENIKLKHAIDTLEKKIPLSGDCNRKPGGKVV